VRKALSFQHLLGRLGGREPFNQCPKIAHTVQCCNQPTDRVIYSFTEFKPGPYIPSYACTEVPTTNHENAVVILTHNSMGVLPDCIDAVQANAGEWDIFVVDNDSDDNVGEYLAQQYPSVEFTPLDTNEGYTGGNHVAFKATKNYGNIAVVNPDVTVTPGCLDRMLGVTACDANIGIVVPKLTLASTGLIDAVGGGIDYKNAAPVYYGRGEVDAGQYTQHRSVDCAPGTCMLLTRACLDETGGFDNSYFMYWEDNDLSTRAKRAGYDIICEPIAHAIHAKGNSSSHTKNSPLLDLALLKTYYYTRNSLLYFSEHGDNQETTVEQQIMTRVLASLKFVRDQHMSQQATVLKIVLKAMSDFTTGQFGPYEHQPTAA
jgi:N-acetylglucosaminyl-diphospho-decaprenol L-rhamnosyltransferase